MKKVKIKCNKCFNQKYSRIFIILAVSFIVPYTLFIIKDLLATIFFFLFFIICLKASKLVEKQGKYLYFDPKDNKYYHVIGPLAIPCKYHKPKKVKKNA